MRLAAFHRRWSAPNGYHDVLRIGLPMVASMGAHTLMLFTDRYFLSMHSLDAIAASWPAGMASFTFASFFLGTAQYINVFIAQYMGSEAPRRVGAALWQGIWFSLLAGVVLAATALIAVPLFALLGHAPSVQVLEVEYFQILSLGGVFGLLQNTLACFYSGRGLTKQVMYANSIGVFVNIPLNYCLIFGVGPFPELGVAGAAIATVAAGAISAVIFAVWIFTKDNEERFGVRTERAIDWKLMRRFFYYGAPGGVEFFVEMVAFTVFLGLAGRISTEALAATNMAISINTLGFLPMVGMNIALSTMVGQAIGKGAPMEAREATRSATHIAMVWSMLTIIVYLGFAEPLISLFLDAADPATPAVLALGMHLMMYVAAYATLDALLMVYFGVLKGAGDTLFVMGSVSVLAVVGIIIPGIAVVEWLESGVEALWMVFTVYVFMLCAIGYLRYRGGRWEHMRVVETAPLV